MQIPIQKPEHHFIKHCTTEHSWTKVLSGKLILSFISQASLKPCIAVCSPIQSLDPYKLFVCKTIDLFISVYTDHWAREGTVGIRTTRTSDSLLSMSLKGVFENFQTLKGAQKVHFKVKSINEEHSMITLRTRNVSIRMVMFITSNLFNIQIYEIDILNIIWNILS